MKPTAIPFNITLSKKLSSAELTLILLFEEDNLSNRLKNFFDNQTLKLLSADFKNKANELYLTYSASIGRVSLVGLGPKRKLTLDGFRRQVQAGVLASKNFDIANIQIVLPALPKQTRYLEMAAFACGFARYSFDYYKKEKTEQKAMLQNINLIYSSNTQNDRQAVERGYLLSQIVNKTRDLANHPANIATPRHLASHAIDTAKKYHLKIKVLDEKAIKKEGLGLLWGVALGSDEPPRLIVMEYLPVRQAGGNPKLSPIALVGKGLTFDSGGLSIKPAEKMDEMKYDMAGGAIVLGIMEAAARLGLRQHLVGIIPASENLLSGRAVKPGDILTAHDKQTVEVVDTDAEGRLILADAISYAKKYYQPKLIMDFATLTGGVIVALGDEYTGYLSNTAKFDGLLARAAVASGEKLWKLPLPDEYQEQLKSGFADIKNLGDRRFASPIVGALFLKNFVGDTPWIHFDIAGTAWSTKAKSYLPAGATGWGVYLTTTLLKNLK